MTDQPTNPNALDTMIDNEFESGKKRGPAEEVSLCNREWMEILTEYRAMRSRIADLEDALRELVGWQNGPPLLSRKWQEGWTRAMNGANAVLDERKPTDDRQS